MAGGRKYMKSTMGKVIPLLTILLVMCTRQPTVKVRDCIEAWGIQTPLNNFVDLTLSEASAWIEKNYNVLAEKITKTQYVEGSTSLSWSTGRINYRLFFINEPSIHRLEVIYNSQVPTYREFVNCFGEPSFYRSRLEPGIHTIHFSTEFWNIKNGVFTFTIAALSTKVPPKLTDELLLDTIYVVKSKNVNDMAVAAFPFAFKEGKGTDVIAKLHPWPGGLDKIVTDVSPYLK